MADFGIAPTWRDFPDGTGAMVAALNAGQLDVAVLLTEGAVAGIDRGGRFEILSVFTESPLIWGVHVPAASSYQEVADLAGGRFAVSRFGSGSHLMSFALAKERAWSVDDLRFVVVGTLSGAIDSFREQKSDAFLWEKFMTQPLVDQGEFRRVGEFIAPWPAFVICAARDTLASKRLEIEQLIGEVGREARALAESSDAAADISAQYELGEASVAQWLSVTKWAYQMTDPAPAVSVARSALAHARALDG